MSSILAAFGHAARTLKENASSAMNRSNTTASGLAAASAASNSAPLFGGTWWVTTPDADRDSACRLGLAHATKWTRQPHDWNARSKEPVRTPAAELLASGHRKLTNITDLSDAGDLLDEVCPSLTSGADDDDADVHAVRTDGRRPFWTDLAAGEDLRDWRMDTAPRRRHVAARMSSDARSVLAAPKPNPRPVVSRRWISNGIGNFASRLLGRKGTLENAFETAFR